MSDKPKFDPGQPFEPIGKPAFNPGEAFEEIPEEKKPWLEAGPITIKNNPLDVDWLGAAKDEVTKPLDPNAKAALENPLMGAFSPAAGAATTAAAGAARGLVESAVTSPIPAAISRATNVVGKTKGLAERLASAIGDKLPQGMKLPLDWATEVAGRKAAYSNPLTGIPQGISDATNVISKAQKGAAWGLDHLPVAENVARKTAPVAAGAAQAMISTRKSQEPEEVMAKAQGTRFQGQLQDAMSRGEDAYKSTVFLLGQQYPEFRELVSQEH